MAIRTRVIGWSVVLAGLLLGSAAPAAQAAPQNVVVEWNLNMLAAVATANVPPPAANRLGGIVQAAVFDAVNGIEQRYTPIHVAALAPEDASPRAAAATAAYTMLVSLFPAQKANLDAELAATMRAISDDDDRAVSEGAAWGAFVANQILTWRSADGFSAVPPPYVFGTAPGQYQPTPGGSGPPKFRTLATTTPFALSSPSEFRPAGPPALTSARYAQDLNEVRAFGGAVTSARSPVQTETARFWQLDLGLAMWDRVADTLLIEHHKNLLQSARILALTDISVTDSIIAVFDAKNAYNFWRPVTAINATLDPTWLPLLITPYFQEYPSAHAGTSSAAAATLASFFGDATTFTMTSAGLPGVQRTFTSFHEAVAQVSDARVFAGFHFRFSCDDANAMGAQVSAAVLSRLMQPAHDD